MKKLLLILCLLLLPSLAQAQTTRNPCYTTGPQGNTGLPNCIGVGTATPLPVSPNPYPAGATVVGNAFSGADTASAAAVLPAAAGKFTYICGFTVSGLGGTGAFTSDVTVGILVGSTTAHYTYVFALGATVQNTALNVSYSSCVPASAVNSAITVTVPGDAGNTATQINAWGFQL